MSSPDQLVLLLDIDAPADEDGVLEPVPDKRRNRQIVRLSDFGSPVWSEMQPRDQLDWRRIGAAILALHEHVRRALPSDGRLLEVYVGGHAPLSVFFAVGLVLDPRTMKVVSIQRRKTEAKTWDVFDLCSTASGGPLLKVSGVPAEPAEGSGRVAVLLSTQLTSPATDKIRSAIQAHGDDLLSVARLLTPTTDPVIVDPTNIGVLVRQINDLFLSITGAFPHRTGLSVFLAGPTSLALAAGMVVNPNQFLSQGHTIELCEYVAGPYARVLSMPIEVARQVEVPGDAESELRRIRAFDHFKSGVELLKSRLEPDHVFVPRGFALDESDAQALGARALTRLRELRLPNQMTAGAFEIDTLAGELRLGHGLMHPLSAVDAEPLKRLGQLFTLHEVVHEDQGVGSHNYQGIGRSGVVLEDVDFWADAFAIGTAVLHHIARNGLDAAERPGEILTGFIDAHIEAMRAFDRMEQGDDFLRVLPERRLRRYLIWHLQRARASAVSLPAHVRLLLGSRLFVELAPLRGHLNERHDKIVESATQEVCLALALGGRAKWLPPLPNNFSPQVLLEAVRRFDDSTIQGIMSYVVNEAKPILVSWLHS
jgi:hypothetical protein